MLIFPRDREELVRIIKFTHSQRFPTFVFGQGSNILVKDKGVKGVVICLRRGFKKARLLQKNILQVEAGVKLAQLLKTATLANLGGLEFLVGIPGSVGGALIKNAGARGKTISERCSQITIISWEGVEKIFSKSALKFGYRECLLPEPGIILSTQLQLQPTPREIIEGKLAQYLQEKKRHQPLSAFSAGCVFKNPSGVSAGELIEKCGLKGKTWGGVLISRKHANFIVNRGGGKAEDVIALINLIREEVYKSFKIELELELQIIGE